MFVVLEHALYSIQQSGTTDEGVLALNFAASRGSPENLRMLDANSGFAPDYPDLNLQS